MVTWHDVWADEWCRMRHCRKAMMNLVRDKNYQNHLVVQAGIVMVCAHSGQGKLLKGSSAMVLE